MVDVRPLLFINVLLVMLLLTAGFAHVQTPQELKGNEVPTANVSELPTPNKSDTQVTVPDKSEIIEQTVTRSSIDLPVEQEISSTEIPQNTDHPNAETTAPGIENATEVDAEPIESAPIEQAPVVVAEKPVKMPPPTPVEIVAAPVVKPKPAPKPQPTTGHLTIRSNVGEDVVLIDGVPQGSTKLDVDLAPGSYNIEVAKSGFTSWKADITVVKGESQTLKARLEEYTSVEYANGEWRNGVTTGEGAYFGQDGTEYHGSFVNGMFHGKGTVRYKDGTNYQGEWFQGKMQGDGNLVTATGDSYTGQFKDSKFNGEGTLTKANGDIYSGYWVNGMLSGQGTLTTTDGLLYVGGFSNNQFHGNGTLTFPDGRHYDGSFSKGIFHGKGEEIYTNGKKYSGYFMDGQYHGEGELMNPNGSKISGTFKFGKPFGRATLTTPEGEVFTANTNEPGVCYRDKSYRATECPPMEGW